MARGIRKLKQEYAGRQKEFEEFARKVTENYARSMQEYSQELVAKDFDVSVSTLRWLMDYAIEEALVTIDVAIYVAQKSIHNQQKKHPEAGGTSIRHHKELIKKREQKIAERFPEYEIELIVFEVLHGGEEIENVIKKYSVESERVYKLLLKRAVIENICSDEDVDILAERSYKKEITMHKIRFFRELIEKREEFKRKK